MFSCIPYNQCHLGIACVRKASATLSAHTTMNWLIGTKLWMDAKYEELMIYALQILIF